MFRRRHGGGNHTSRGRICQTFIAISTTAHARFKLYEALETLRERVLYYDTDSVIYKWRPGHTEIPLGFFLGDFTDECEGDPIVCQWGSQELWLCHKGRIIRM